MANENFPAIITNQTNTEGIWHFLFLTPVFLYHVIDNGDSAKVNTKSKEKKRIIVSSVLSTGILFVGLCLVLYVWKKKQQKNSKYSHHQMARLVFY
jgi:Ca2+/H+ antiporter